MATVPSQPGLPAERLTFRAELAQQRWDDHRYYHQSRINQSLHFFSSLCFLASYVVIFFSPAVAVLIGWLLAMCSRQAGHFFFEPKAYDAVNEATHEHKEDIKVGYNLYRKRVLHGIWAAVPVVLYFNPSLLGLIQPAWNVSGYVHNVAMLWLVVAVSALVFRTVQLFFLQSVQTGLVWATKILTDPFHDFRLYAGAPARLLKGELLDPMHHVHGEAEKGGRLQVAR